MVFGGGDHLFLLSSVAGGGEAVATNLGGLESNDFKKIFFI